MVWFLLGLLFNAGGLYLGFDFSMAFVYMMIGWFCCAYGVALFIFRLRENPNKSVATRLSPNFVSLNSTHSPPPRPVEVEEEPKVRVAPAINISSDTE